MQIHKRVFVVIIVLLAVLGAGYVGNQLALQSNFARAQSTVREARVKLQTASDLIQAFKDVGKAVEPSVVNISVRKTAKAAGPRPMPDEDWLRRFFPDRDGDGEPDVPEGFREREAPDILRGTGSGVIVDFDASAKKAWIVTNNHVAGGAEEMLITLWDGRQISGGKLVGTDPKSDLAVVTLEVDRVIAAKWGNSDELEKGDWVLAFGSPFGYVGSMTHGIVSALDRQAGLLGSMGYENFIQVDAPINPGNSGGPLVNLHGEVIGINTAIASRTGGFQGIGFAIPANQAKFVYQTLREKGKIVRGWLGVSIQDVSRDRAQAEAMGYKGEHGVIVRETFRNTPAYGKLQPGDVITHIDGKQVKTMRELRDQIARTAPGADARLSVVREGKNTDVVVKLGEQPDDMVAMRQPGKTPPHRESPADAIGVRVADLSDALSQKHGVGDLKEGAVVTAVEPRSLAAVAGLSVGDVIIRIGDKPVKNAEQFVQLLKEHDLKRGVRMTVSGREGSRLVFIRAERD